MTQSSLTQEQETAMAELLQLTKDAEEKLRETSKVLSFRLLASTLA